MLWCEVRVEAPLAEVEVVAEAMRSVAPGGVSIEEPVVPLGPEEGVRLEAHRPAIVACYLPVDDGLGARLDDLDARLAARGLHPPIATRRVDEADWADAWKEHFHVERYGRRLVVRPSWRAYDPGPDEVVIDLDPGMAFGTGQHETTRGCLELLEDTVPPGAHVLDVGTGSGILAIAALKLGAARADALDIEPQSVAVARENADRNGVGGRLRAALGSLGDAWPFPEPPTASAGLVLANIHARALIALAGDLAAAVRPGGVLILSGIIADREADVLEAFAALGPRPTRRIAAGDWRTLQLQC
jgi:ribosomal protein L11 methyltransferase